MIFIGASLCKMPRSNLDQNSFLNHGYNLPTNVFGDLTVGGGVLGTAKNRKKKRSINVIIALCAGLDNWCGKTIDQYATGRLLRNSIQKSHKI